jgi:hypothetical protein
MALIEKISRQVQRYRDQEVVECTYDVLTDAAGRKYLQLLTYGSPGRKEPGKVSQNVRFGPVALAELKRIIQEHNL